MWEPVRNVKSRTHFAATATGALSATAAAKCGREELPHVRGQGQKPGGPNARRAAAKSARLQRRRNGREELPKSEVRGGGREDQPHVQGAVVAQAQEGLEVLYHVEGQEGRR